MQHRQPWIYKSWVDLLFIVAPAFLATLVVLLFPGWFEDSEAMPPLAWLLLIVGVDVAHVYSTLWRTYLDPTEFDRHRNLLTYTPIAVWVGGILLYSMGPMVFWRVLAYLAVFHFVRQQYGLCRSTQDSKTDQNGSGGSMQRQFTDSRCIRFFIGIPTSHGISAGLSKAIFWL
ncbi:MAG: hypothetical protein IPN95_08730 [Bacteroidetes bacterium]|nr:hypothetical protein [Bacteroidota bacterium]